MTRLGLGNGWKCLFANDICPKKRASYRANFGDGALKVCDVADLIAHDLPGQADLVAASPPCQDLSLAGDRAGLGGARSGVFWEFIRILRELVADGRAPRLVVVENVPGWRTSGKGADFQIAREALQQLGYHVVDCDIDAADFLPQSRLRTLLIGSRTPFPWSTLPQPQPDPRRPSLASLIDLDAPCDRPEKTERILAEMSATNRAKVEEAKAAGALQVGTLFRRTRAGPPWEVRFDGVAGCLRVATGGSSRQSLMLVEGNRIRTRLMVPREAARLMGLPDNYILPANVNEALTLVGDGVAVPVVAWLAERVLEPLLANSLKEAAE
jgi:DNA (cytosine-5)-methyltransferase 1